MKAKVASSVAAALALLVGVARPASAVYDLVCSFSGTIHLDPGINGQPAQQPSGFTVHGVLSDCPEEAGTTLCANGTLVGNCGGNQNQASYVTCRSDCDPNTLTCSSGSPVTSGGSQGGCVGPICLTIDDETNPAAGVVALSITESVDPASTQTCLTGGTVTDSSFVGQIVVIEK